MLYMVTFTINIPQMLAYIPYMDPMGYGYFRQTPRWYPKNCWPMDANFPSNMVIW